MRYERLFFLSVVKLSLIFFGVTGLLSAGGCAGKSESQRHIAQRKGFSPRTEKKIVEDNDKVKVYYTGRLQDGTVFDQSQEGLPLEFIVGRGQVIAGFEEAVLGMKVNEKKEVTIPPQDGYPRYEERVRDFARAGLPQGFIPEIDMPVQMQDDTGRIIPGLIIDMDDRNITVDFNHPLAGKTLVFDIEVVSIE